MNHVYKVPIIPQNLSKQETIVQVAEVLNHLSDVTDDMLKHINNKVESSYRKLSDISDRITEVNKKITKLSGAKKATQVFSSCKYPATDVNRPYISIFSEAKFPEITRCKVKHKKLTPSEEPLDKLYVYHVKVKNNDSKETVSGLGVIPNDIDNVSDLILYNSGKNLYQNFVMSDALEVSQQIPEKEISDNSSIGVAPHSISERSTLTRSSTQNYFYAPNLGEVPALDVPLDLPDLPNIADDLRYDTELGPGIAPSVITTSNIPDLPIVKQSEEPSKDNLTEIELPPLPPPPIIESPKIIENKIIEEEPPKLTTSTIEDKPLSESSPKLPELPQSDVRASLMEAIRKAGGSKNLKSTSVNKDDTPKPMTGGDLMADLHAKLSMRRRGISGTKKLDSSMDASSALSRMSAMIPPPVPTNEINDNTEDEDWDD